MPSIKILFIFIAAVLAVVAIFTSVQYSSKGPSETYTAPSIAIESENTDIDFEVSDSDKDGLPDWKELVYGTDSNNPDTDGDGILDGEEDLKEKQNLKVSSSKDAENVSEFAKSFFSQFLQLKDTGGSVSPEEQAYLLEQTLEDNQYPKDTYTQRNVEINYVENENIWRNYGNFVGGILINNLPVGGSPVAILAEALNEESGEALDQIKPFKERYRAIEINFQKISIPYSLVETHLGVINSSKVLADSLEDMGQLFKDPMKAFIGLRNYSIAADILSENLAEYRNIFEVLEVSFSTEEGGYIFMY